MLMLETRDIGWWYWLVTACLLSWGLVGQPLGFQQAMALTLVHLLHFAIWKKSLTCFPVQVRFFYLLLLLLAWLEPLRWLYWVPAVGTWAQVIFGYCAMARLVSLLPWNKDEPYSLGLFTKTFLTRPVRGNIKQGFAADV